MEWVIRVLVLNKVIGSDSITGKILWYENNSFFLLKQKNNKKVFWIEHISFIYTKNMIVKKNNTDYSKYKDTGANIIRQLLLN